MLTPVVGLKQRNWNRRVGARLGSADTWHAHADGKTGRRALVGVIAGEGALRAAGPGVEALAVVDSCSAAVRV